MNLFTASTAPCPYFSLNIFYLDQVALVSKLGKTSLTKETARSK